MKTTATNKSQNKKMLDLSEMNFEKKKEMNSVVTP